MILSEYEKESALWKKIETHLGDRLHIYRHKNDGDLNDNETAKLRGTIAAIKEILAWAESPGPTMQ